MDDVVAGLLNGEFQFWPGERSACVTEVIEYPRRKALVFWLMGGDLSEAMSKIEPEARAWGEAQGCTLFMGYAVDRPGWTRALQRYGYTPGWRVFRRSSDVA
jgi:hypothetical protein